MDLKGFMRLFDLAVESAADWHSEHEARVADQVIAIAFGSRQGFVQYRDRPYLLPPEDVGRDVRECFGALLWWNLETSAIRTRSV